MRILQITPQMPYPPDSGGRVGILNSIVYLSRIHDITLLSFCTHETERYSDDLKTYCRDVIAVRHPSGGSYWAMAANLFSPMPYTIARFRSVEMMSRVKQLVESGAFDVVHVDHLHMAQYIHGVPNEIPTVLREHNVESVIMRRFSERSSNPLKRRFAAIQARKLDRYESDICSLFTRTVPVTEVDGAALRKMSPKAHVTVIPSGVDTELFRGDAADESIHPMSIITTGDYGWPPTADGLHFLINDILPLIQSRVAEVRLVIIGRNIPESIRNSADSSSLHILGRVEDVRPEILKSAVFVVPTRIGSGIRLKILEAMALSRPVVSTSIGCEGIEAVHGKDILIADEPTEFADAVLDLLGDRDRAAKLADSALALVEESYAWTNLAKRFDVLYRSLIS